MVQAVPRHFPGHSSRQLECLIVGIEHDPQGVGQVGQRQKLLDAAMAAGPALLSPFPLTLLEDPQAGDIGDQPVSAVGPGFVGELRVERRLTKNLCGGLDSDDRPATLADEGGRFIACLGQGMNRARRIVPRSVHDRYVRTRLCIPRATP